MIFDPEQVKIFYNFFNPIKSTWDKNNRRCTPALSGPRSFLSSSPARALLRLRRPSKLHLHCCRRLCRNGRWWFRHFTGVSCSCRGARTCMAVVVQSQNPPSCTCYIHIRISQFSSTGMPGQHRESASTSGQLSIEYICLSVPCSDQSICQLPAGKFRNIRARREHAAHYILSRAHMHAWIDTKRLYTRASECVYPNA